MNRILKYVAIALIAVVYTACESALDTTPSDLIDASQAFRSVADLEAGAQGVYGTYAGVNGAEVIYAINALMSEELRRAESNTGQGMQLFNHNLITSDNTALAAWTSAYYTIDRANRVLAAIDAVETNTAAEEARKNRVRGELLGMRAWVHFDLYRTYSNYAADALAVPYMVQSQISSPERPSAADFFQLLNADIDQAVGLLQPAGFNVGSDDNNRINFRALQGLRARIALYREDWPAAIENATEVINNVPLTSLADYADIWSDDEETEVLFKLIRVAATAGQIEIFERATNPDVFFWASNQLANLYDVGNDVRFDSFLNDEPEANTFRVTKYNQRLSEAKNLADIKVMRVSEMYLIRAEAYVRSATPNLGNAAADITALRAQRYNNPPATTFSSANDAMQDIRLERRLELAFEGHRYYDLKRYGLPIVRQPLDVDGATASDGIDPSDASKSHMFVFPIPQTELFANPNIQPNPGYN
ncbi:MAG: RagB/SusD family nutrient uptake outer membrane protein [Balneolales bacterium]|nr:RagB/SusD family nutrient uptake outer membrane protein [Balneolales bacterium]